MTDRFDIQYISRESILIKKWDGCIGRAENGLLYAGSHYLDAMAGNWDGLVLNDYEAVMPLTWKKKYGIHYLYQPFLTAQLGVFGNNLDAGLLSRFLQAVPEKFRYWDICLNSRNCFTLENFKIYLRNNFILDLNKPYEEINTSYPENLHRNIRKAEQLGCTVKRGIEVEKIIELARRQMKNYVKETDQNLERFSKLYRHLQHLQSALNYGVLSPAGELLASCVFFISGKRAYYLLVGNAPAGKSTGASHMLIDHFIRDHCGRPLTLDFEGSDIPGLAGFYRGFGAVEEKYAAIKMNKLPFYLKWLKN